MSCLEIKQAQWRTWAARDRLDGVCLMVGSLCLACTPTVATGSETSIYTLAAAGTGQAELVERLLDLDLECSLVDVNGWAPLTHASAGGHAGCVGLLLAAGASVGGPDVHSRTPLHWAAERGWVDVVTLLVPAMMLEGQDLGLQVGRRDAAVGCMLSGVFAVHSLCGGA